MGLDRWRPARAGLPCAALEPRRSEFRAWGVRAAGNQGRVEPADAGPGDRQVRDSGPEVVRLQAPSRRGSSRVWTRCPSWWMPCCQWERSLDPARRLAKSPAAARDASDSTSSTAHPNGGRNRNVSTMAPGGRTGPRLPENRAPRSSSVLVARLFPEGPHSAAPRPVRRADSRTYPAGDRQEAIRQEIGSRSSRSRDHSPRGGTLADAGSR